MLSILIETLRPVSNWFPLLFFTPLKHRIHGTGCTIREILPETAGESHHEKNIYNGSAYLIPAPHPPAGAASRARAQGLACRTARLFCRAAAVCADDRAGEARCRPGDGG